MILSSHYVVYSQLSNEIIEIFLSYSYDNQLQFESEKKVQNFQDKMTDFQKSNHNLETMWPITINVLPSSYIFSQLSKEYLFVSLKYIIFEIWL